MCADGAFCPRFVLFHNYLLFWRCVTISRQGTTDQRTRSGTRSSALSTRTALSWALCPPAQAHGAGRAEKSGPGENRSPGETRRCARSLTTANTALNRPSGKRKRERTSVSLRSRRSAFPSISTPTILRPRWNHAMRFISEGNKVKVSIRFRGREMGHPELGLRDHAAVCRRHERIGQRGKARQAGGHATC